MPIAQTNKIIAGLNSLQPISVEKMLGFFTALECTGQISASSIGIDNIPKEVVPVTPNAGRSRGPSKAVQAILSQLTANTGGMTATAITAEVGSTVKANRVTPTLQTMEKRGLVYTKARKWFAGTAPTTTQEETPRRKRGRPSKAATGAPPAKTATRPYKLSEGVMRAISNGYNTPPAMITYLQQTYGGDPARANHVGIALKRHLRGGRLALTGQNNWSLTGAGQQELAQAS